MLRYRADLRTLAFVGAWYALLAALWTAPVGLPLLAGTAAMCLLTFFCAVITHNTIHVPIFRQRTLNLVFQAVLTLVYGHPVSAYVPGHNLSHHRYVQTRRDVMRTSKLRYRWNLLNQLLFLPGVASSIFKADMAYALAMHRQRPRWFRQFCVEWAVFGIVQVSLLALDWRHYLLLVFIPHNYAAWGIVGINFAQHDGCDVSHPYNHSRNFTSRLLNWFAFNNGYHGIHHVHPALHWSLLPAAHEREMAPHVHPNLERPSLLAWAWESFIAPGERLNYDGTPVLLPDDGPDEDWIPSAPDDADLADLGAAG